MPAALPIANPANDHKDELEVMRGDGPIAVPQRLEQADLFAFERNKPRERQIDEECRYEQENRRQRAAHVVEHVEFVVEEGVRGLVLATVSGATTVAIQDLIDVANNVGLRGTPEQLDRERRKRAFEVVGCGEGLLRHPDDPEPAVIGHEVARTDRIDEFR